MTIPHSLPIAAELARRGIRPSRRLGQNFMVDRQMLDFIVRSADVGSGDVVLEVGTGAGFLTERLCEKAAQVVSVEIDSRLYNLAAERLSGSANLTLVNADVLGGRRAWNEPVVRAVNQALRAAGPAVLKLVSNLPYGVATAVVQASLEGGLPLESLVFTCQREVAERLRAAPGTASYGFISVLTALLADVRVIRWLPPSVFWPRPKVDSAIVDIAPSAEKRTGIADMGVLREGVSLLFAERRRKLRAALKRFPVDSDCRLNPGEISKRLGLLLEERVFKLGPERIREVVEAVLLPVRRRGDG